MQKSVSAAARAIMENQQKAMEEQKYRKTEQNNDKNSTQTHAKAFTERHTAHTGQAELTGGGRGVR